jgi:hypothetical protein
MEVWPGGPPRARSTEGGHVRSDGRHAGNAPAHLVVDGRTRELTRFRILTTDHRDQIYLVDLGDGYPVLRVVQARLEPGRASACLE